MKLAQRQRVSSARPSPHVDVLIALCARRIGALLFTYNAADFLLIRKHKDFALRVLSAE